MSIGVGALFICALIGVCVVIYSRFHGVGYYNRHATWSEASSDGCKVTAIGYAFVLIAWFIAGVPVSTLERTACQREADGYGLDYDWSFRNSCRIELPTGQLVPADSIRITSDGEITTGDN